MSFNKLLKKYNMTGYQFSKLSGIDNQPSHKSERGNVPY